MDTSKYPYKLPDGCPFRIGGNNDTAFILWPDIEYGVVVGEYERAFSFDECPTADEAAKAFIAIVKEQIDDGVW